MLVSGYFLPNLDSKSENTDKRLLSAWAAKLTSAESALITSPLGSHLLINLDQRQINNEEHIKNMTEITALVIFLQSIKWQDFIESNSYLLFPGILENGHISSHTYKEIILFLHENISCKDLRSPEDGVFTKTEL